MKTRVIVTYEDGRVVEYPDAKVSYDSKRGVYTIEKADGIRIQVPKSRISNIKISKER